jgi:hypothetical protein
MTRTLRLEPLDARELPSVTVSSPAEAFSWVLVNQLRQDPVGFANQLDGLRRGTVPSAFGFSRSDPVVADINRLIGYSTYPSHYRDALNMLRSATPTGPLGWDDVLEDRAHVHTEWMKTHAFEHTGQDHPQKWYVAGFRTSYTGGDPDQWGYAPGRYYWWGEDIGYTYGLMANSKAAFAAGRFGRIGFQERAAFIDTVSYVLEVNSPDMYHLQQLLRPDGGPDTGTPQFNAVGMDVQFYEGPLEVRDGLGEATISTHRFGLYRPGGSGGFITGVAYRDVNNNGWFDAGEGIGATLNFSGPATFTETLDRLGSQGVSSNYVPDGTYTVTATAADGTPLGTQTVTIADHNGWFAFRQTGSLLQASPALVTSPTGTSGVRPTVTWAPVPDAVGYLIRVNNTTTGAVNLFPGATSLGNAWTPPVDLVPGFAYRVSVRPLFSDHDGAWGPASDFKVDVPKLTGLSGLVNTVSPSFGWIGPIGATRYVLVLDDLTAGKRVATVATTGQNWYPPTPLLDGHVYRWRVSAKNASGLGLWSPATDFRVDV